VTHTLLGDRRGQQILQAWRWLLTTAGLVTLAALHINGGEPAWAAGVVHPTNPNPGASLVVLGVGIALAVVVTIVQFVHSEVVR